MIKPRLLFSALRCHCEQSVAISLLLNRFSRALKSPQNDSKRRYCELLLTMTTLFSIILFSQNALAQSEFDEIPDALMFSIDDMFSIESAIADCVDFSQKDLELYKETDSTAGTTAFLPSLHLSAIMYYGANNWTIWINDTPYKHDTISNYFRIIRVSANYIELSVKNETGVFLLIKLKPNQTFMVISRKIEEGRNP